MQPILIVFKDPEALAENLEPRFPELEFRYADTPEQVEHALQAYDPEVVYLSQYRRRVIDHPSVRWVHVGGSGYDHLLPWDPERVTVTNSTGVLAPYLAETVIAAMLALNANLPRYAEHQRQRTWRRQAFRPLAGQTLLVVGLGHVGAQVASKARALGMQVLATRRTHAPHPAADEVHPPGALMDLIGRADYVSLHVRLTEQTRQMMDVGALTAMRRTACLLNTARGGLLDETALVEAIEGGQIAGAYLDVFETEPLPPSSPLWTLPNVLLTPHASDNIIGWPTRFARLFGDNLVAHMTGQPMVNVVIP